MIGAGAQGRTAAACLHQVFPAAEMVVADLSAERRQAFRNEMAATFHVSVADAPTVESAVTGADIVVLLTTAKAPFIKAKWIAEGCVTLAMGSYQQAEDDLILHSDKKIVDSWGQAGHRGELKALAESGRIAEGDIYAELGPIAAGKRPGRESETERILAVLVGLGAHDVFIAAQVYHRAVRKGVGQRVRLNPEPAR